jgi:hypothetical protein
MSVGNEAVLMNRMVCEDCRSVFYSAAARILVENGERCSNCGGRLRLEPEPGRGDRVPVAPNGEQGHAPEAPPRDHPRRFDRGPRDPEGGAA